MERSLQNIGCNAKCLKFEPLSPRQFLTPRNPDFPISSITLEEIEHLSSTRDCKYVRPSRILFSHQ